MVNEPAAWSLLGGAVSASDRWGFNFSPTFSVFNKNKPHSILIGIPLLGFVVEIEVQTVLLTSTHVCDVELVKWNSPFDDFFGEGLPGRIHAEEVRAQAVEKAKQEKQRHDTKRIDATRYKSPWSLDSEQKVGKTKSKRNPAFGHCDLRIRDRFGVGNLH